VLFTVAQMNAQNYSVHEDGNQLSFDDWQKYLDVTYPNDQVRVVSYPAYLSPAVGLPAVDQASTAGVSRVYTTRQMVPPGASLPNPCCAVAANVMLG
jgi:hypothetical protein